MKKKMFLTIAAVAVVVVGARAQAQVILAPAGQAYTIANNASATAVNPVTYQWYRNNNPIAGATGESYTVPRAYAYGDNVQFYRLATAQECAGVAEKSSNVITITFTGYTLPSEGCNLIIDGVCWADVNVGAAQTFAERADMHTHYYQWNRLTAYSAEDPVTPAWNSNPNNSETWTVNPCPNGWRLPSLEEYKLLQNSGSTWAAAASVQGNAVNGRFYGYSHATCTLPSHMSGCVFFPASGMRDYDAGAHLNLNGAGLYWTSTNYEGNSGYRLNFSKASSTADNTYKAYGKPLRCVK